MGTVQPDESLTGHPLYIRLAPEYRRCGIYVLVGYPVILGTAILSAWIARGFPRIGVPDLLREAPLFIILTPYLILSLILLRWCLRVDDRGIARRRFWRWDLWPWEAFANGRVYSSCSQVFECPEKPWQHRVLLLCFLAKDGATLLGDRIKKVWKPPPVPAVEEVTIDYFDFAAIIGTKRVRFHRQGIDLRVKEREFFYPWSAVQKIRLTRTEHDYRDFYRLELILPDQSIRFGATKRSGGPFRHDIRCRAKTEAREIIAALLLNHVPPDRVIIIASTGLPRSQEECDERLAELDRRCRENSHVRWVFGCMLVALYSLPVIFGNWRLVWPAIMLTVLILLAFWASRQHDKMLSRKRAELEDWNRLH